MLPVIWGCVVVFASVAGHKFAAIWQKMLRKSKFLNPDIPIPVSVYDAEYCRPEKLFTGPSGSIMSGDLDPVVMHGLTEKYTKNEWIYLKMNKYT